MDTTNKEKKKINFPLILSTTSLMLSLTVFYFANFRVVHSLKVTYQLSATEYNSDTVFTPYCTTVFQNHGNRTEAVLGTWYYFLDSTHHRMFGYHYRDSSFLIKPAEIVLDHYKFIFPEWQAYYMYRAKKDSAFENLVNTETDLDELSRPVDSNFYGMYNIKLNKEEFDSNNEVRIIDTNFYNGSYYLVVGYNVTGHNNNIITTLEEPLVIKTQAYVYNAHTMPTVYTAKELLQRKNIELIH